VLLVCELLTLTLSIMFVVVVTSVTVLLLLSADITDRDLLLSVNRAAANHRAHYSTAPANHRARYSTAGQSQRIWQYSRPITVFTMYNTTVKLSLI